MSDLNNPIFQDADKAREFLETARWPNGPVCPHCGEFEKIHKLEGKAHRPGLYQCNSCMGQFSVTVGTVFERSKIALNKWLLATYLLSASKKGISSHQLHRMLGVTYKTAWFMTHRIREAMRDGTFPGPMGGEGKTVEADETYFGKTKEKKSKGKRGVANKRAVVSLVERGGKVRSFHMKNHPTVAAVREIVVKNIARETDLRTDESRLYTETGKEFASHETVHHSSGQYVRGDIHTNTIEGYFSIFKRGMIGVYQHCGEQHLKRYLAEFDFRYNHRSVTDAERAVAALKGIEGKRLTYRRTGERAHQ